MGSRAIALLLLFVFLAVPACANEPPGAQGAEQNNPQQAAKTGGEQAKTTGKEVASSGETTVEAVLPEDVLSEEERTGVPEFNDWDDKGGEAPKLANTTNSSVGAIPAVKPFNFGRDPGGPEDKTLYLTVPKLDIYDAPVYNSISEEKLKASVVHVPATGFPWQEGANTYIAGHRLGYEGTGSYLVFYDLDLLAAGDEILLKDSAGGEYYYRVTEQKVVGPDNVEVMDATAGRSLVSLQTCTLPDYTERIVVQGELVETRQA